MVAYIAYRVLSKRRVIRDDSRIWGRSTSVISCSTWKTCPSSTKVGRRGWMYRELCADD
jgi:hypothetical protein